MLKIARKIKKNLVANHANDIVFVAGKEVFVINKANNVMAKFNSHVDYLRDNAIEYTNSKEEFMSAMEKVWEALEANKTIKKFDTSYFKKQLSMNYIIDPEKDL